MERLPHDFVTEVLQELTIKPKVLAFFKEFGLNESTTQNAFLRAIIQLYIVSPSQIARDTMLHTLKGSYPWLFTSQWKGQKTLEWIENVITDVLEQRISS